MDTETEMGGVMALNGARADFYRFMASLFLYELTQEQVDCFAATRLPDDGGLIGRGYADIAEYLRHRDTGTRQELACDYARIFLGAGSYDELAAPPYESVYTSEERLLMQQARDEALACYRAEGLDLGADNTTPEDHAGFELQFMALLAQRSNDALKAGDTARYAELLERQGAFFDGHIANWFPAFADDIERWAKTGFYRGVAQLARGLVDSEREVLSDLLAEQGCEVA